MRPSLATSLLAFAFSLAAPALAAASILITVDRATQRMTVNVDGAPHWVWPVSTGRSGYATPSGNYTAFRMEEDHYSKEFDDAPMPHSIFFTKLGHAIHGTLDARHLGSAASHGCVRLSTANAAKLYALVQEQGLPNTKVVITGATPGSAPAVARRRAPVETGDDAPMAYAPPPQYAPRGAIYQQPAPAGYPQYPQYPPLMRGFPLFGGN
jgi:L,D-transpeptidase catalytic domain